MLVPVINVVPYCCDPCLRQKFMEEGKTSKKYQHAFEESVKGAEEYTEERAKGRMLNFFQWEDTDEEEEEEIEIENNKKTTKQKVNTALKFKDLLQEKRSKRITTSKQKFSKLLYALDKTRPTLGKIFKEEVQCSRHETFLRGTTHEKNSLKYKSGFGPIDDDEITEEISEKLIRWFKEDITTPYHINAVTYVSEVWLPEAIILALMNSQNANRETAEDLYLDCS